MSDQRFFVVYDSTTDRFVLQDEPAAAGTTALPWHEWVLPPKSATTASQGPELGAPVASDATVDATAAVAALELECPASLDQAPIRHAARGGAPRSRAPSPAKRARVRDYTAHFARANAQGPLMDATPDAPQHRASCITWNGEPLHVSVACSSRGIDSSSPPPTPQAALSDPAASVQHVFELAQLARIRPHADGFRAVNTDCTFAALTSSSSSSSSSGSERVSSPSTLSDDDDRARLPVFARGDRVVVRARRRRFHGTVARRIGHSSFYDVRAASGTVFAAVSALRMRLLPPAEPLPPQHTFARGDRVLWVPATAEQHELDSIETQQTYRARVVQRRSRSRFDIELRTGRIRYKVPSSELEPAQW